MSTENVRLFFLVIKLLTKLPTSAERNISPALVDSDDMSLPPSPSHPYVEGTPPPLNAFDTFDEAIDCTLPAPLWTQLQGSGHKTPPEPLLLFNEHPKEAESLIGAFVPDNTRKSNKVALKALGCFCIKSFRAHRMCLIEEDDVEKILLETRYLLFPDGDSWHLPAGYMAWTDVQLKHFRFYLIEFVAKNKSSRTGGDIAPSTLKTYVFGLQRGFSVEWGYHLNLLKGRVFDCPKEGFFAVIENKARQQQRAGHHVVSHNVLSRTELLQIYRSDSLSKKNPRGFLTRLIFTIGIVTGMRPTAFATLTVSQFRRERIRDETVWIISGAVGSACGASKTTKGGWKAIGQKLAEVCVWNESYDEWAINFFSFIDEYIAIRENLEVGTDGFFLATNVKATHCREFFKRQHLGKNAFMNAVRSACIAEVIEGCGGKN